MLPCHLVHHILGSVASLFGVCRACYVVTSLQCIADDQQVIVEDLYGAVLCSYSHAGMLLLKALLARGLCDTATPAPRTTASW